MTSAPKPGFETMIGKALMYGVYVSSVIIFLGMVLATTTIGSSSGCPGALEGLHEGGFGTPGLSLDLMVTGLASLDSQSMMQVGILLLLTIPFFRVIIGGVMYGFQRNWFYVAISLSVLAALLISAFVVAPLEARG